ncbi:SAP domain-containing protein [Alkalibacterium olivapovliticus]|uniref:SAP domain-containing protein n=1 Tax=Alkalibacterium olivapovliticus TaxID=99907 RepID=A0A2T0VQY7_9LACT|nr:SAP domain-containing protein [Alkalibacterium olivapovliticus]PRY72886.1 SAP domain-containing protein [Alkalibacterium olivapovliticus]
MRQFTYKEIKKYLEYTNENIIPLQEVLGKCFICGIPLDQLELSEGPEKQVVCLKDRSYFVESFNSYENAESELEFQPELLKKDNFGLIPGEIILLAWCSGKNTEKKIPHYYRIYAVDVATSIDKLLNKNFLEYGNYHEQLNALTVPQLRELLKDNKIKSKGRKKELVQRLLDNNIHLSNIPEVFKLTDEGEKILQYNEHIVSAHKDKFFPVYMAARYRKAFQYPIRFEELKLGVLDILIEEYTKNNMLFQLSECFEVKGHHLEVYYKNYEQALVYYLLLIIIKLYDLTRKIRFGITRVDYSDIDRLITVGNIDKKKFDYLFDRALNLIDFEGYDLELIFLDEIDDLREIIYNADYIKTQEYIEKYINGDFYIEHSPVKHYMLISDIKKY